jgi:hypothetical protein
MEGEGRLPANFDQKHNLIWLSGINGSGSLFFLNARNRQKIAYFFLAPIAPRRSAHRFGRLRTASVWKCLCPALVPVIPACALLQGFHPGW